MKKIPWLPMGLSLLAVLACSSRGTQEAARQFANEYGAITKKYGDLNRSLSAKINRAASQPEYLQLTQEYNRLQNAHQGELETLLRRHEASPSGDDLQLMRGRVLIELSRFAEADKLLDNLIGRNSPRAAAARFEKIKVCIVARKVDQALALFRQVESTAPHDLQFYSYLMFFALEGGDAKLRAEFARRIVSARDLPAELQSSRPQMFANLAIIAWRDDDLPRAKEILQKAISLSTEERATQALQTRLRQLELIGAPMAQFTAETWFNGSAITPAALKGRVVVLDFWAPWCQPCRLSMPALEKLHRQWQDRGLTLVGLTKLYGNFADETGNRGKVKPELETSLIQAFLKRNAISYPVAVDRQGKSFEAYRITALPTLVIIDRRGIIRYAAIGTSQEPVLIKQIETLLEEKP